MLRKYSRNIEDPMQERLLLGLSQEQFWGALGVSQAGGSRYECGRQMPLYLEILFAIVYHDMDPPTKPLREQQ